MAAHEVRCLISIIDGPDRVCYVRTFLAVNNGDYFSMYLHSSSNTLQAAIPL